MAECDGGACEQVMVFTSEQASPSGTRTHHWHRWPTHRHLDPGAAGSHRAGRGLVAPGSIRVFTTPFGQHPQRHAVV